MAAGAATAVIVLALCILGLVVVDLVRVVDKDGDATSSYGKWVGRISSCRDRVAKVVPLTSIKIVLVAWQIVTQVRQAAWDSPRPPTALYRAYWRVLRILTNIIRLHRPLTTVGDVRRRGSVQTCSENPRQ